MADSFLPFDGFRFEYTLPPSERTEYLLLTVDRTLSVGKWVGSYGENFIAWAPAPARSRSIEKDLIAKGVIRRK